MNKVCLDFYGLPGCGKSTVSHLLANTLQNSGYNTWEPSYLLAHGHSRFCRQVIKALHTFQYSVRHPILTLRLIRLVQKNGYCGVVAVLFAVVNLTNKLYALTHLPHRTEIILFDEGLAQASVSLSALHGTHSAQNYQTLLQFLCLSAQQTQMIGIYCVAPIETAVAQMQKRGTLDSRADRVTDSIKKRRMLLLYENACDEIPNCTLRLAVNGRTPEDLAGEVYQYIHNILS